MKKFIILLLSFLFSPFFLSANEIIYAPDMFVSPTFHETISIYKAEKFVIENYLKINIKNLQDVALVKLKSKDDPSTEADDDELTGYVTDSEMNILIYNPSETTAEFYGKKHFDEELQAPHGIDADINGNVYIADKGNKRIAVFYNDGNKLYFKNQVLLEGTPYDITHNLKEELYVTISDLNYIAKIKNYEMIKKITNSIIKNPRGIKLISSNEKWNRHRSNFIVFINNNGKEIIKMTEEGEILNHLNVGKFFDKKVDLKYITIDYYSNILTADRFNFCIHKFDRNLNYIASFNKLKDENILNEPYGLDIWKRYGQLIVVEKTGGRYYWVGIDIIKFDIQTTSEKIIIDYHCTDPFYITSDLFTKDDKIIKHIYKKQFIKNFKGKLILNKTDDKGNTIPPGEYVLKCKIEPTYSSYTRFHKIIIRDIEL